MENYLSLRNIFGIFGIWNNRDFLVCLNGPYNLAIGKYSGERTQIDWVGSLKKLEFANSCRGQ